MNWISVKDRLPEQGKWTELNEYSFKPHPRILVYDPEWHDPHKIHMGYFDKTKDGRNWFQIIDDGGEDTSFTATHWAELKGPGE